MGELWIGAGLCANTASATTMCEPSLRVARVWPISRTPGAGWPCTPSLCRSIEVMPSTDRLRNSPTSLTPLPLASCQTLNCAKSASSVLKRPSVAVVLGRQALQIGLFAAARKREFRGTDESTIAIGIAHQDAVLRGSPGRVFGLPIAGHVHELLGVRQGAVAVQVEDHRGHRMGEHRLNDGLQLGQAVGF